MSRPVYRSYAESFRLNIYLPDSGLIAPPTAACRADAGLRAAMEDSRPPQAVLMEVCEGLQVPGAGTLGDCMRMIRGRAVPIIRFEDAGTGEEIVRFAQENNLGDVTLCVPYDNRKLLAEIRRRLPLSRGMLDLRGQAVPEFDGLIAECHSSEATMLMMRGAADRALLRRLQKRFIQAWLEDDGNLAGTASVGACGVLTQEIDKLYDLIGRYPEGSVLRPAPLYAHKTWHVTGEYPENSIRGCAAAGRMGFDAAEIDVQLTKDDVMVVQHDRDTRKLFDENHVVWQTGWDVLRKLRRKAFMEDGLDRMDDLMRRMKEYPETPVLIEIKTPPDTFGVEEMVRQLKELLPDETVQKSCTCIMGVMPPYLSYVHEQIPYLPAAHCTCVKGEEATDSIDENNLRIYRFAQETKGANAGFNPYHPMIGRTFARLAHARGLTVFPWTWAFRPWEEEKEAITESFLQGHDGLTSDWVGKFINVPVDVRADLPDQWKAGERLGIRAEKLVRGAGWQDAGDEIEIVPLEGEICTDGNGITAGLAGSAAFAVGVRTILEGGKQVLVTSPAYRIDFV